MRCWCYVFLCIASTPNAHTNHKPVVVCTWTGDNRRTANIPLTKTRTRMCPCASKLFCFGSFFDWPRLATLVCPGRFLSMSPDVRVSGWLEDDFVRPPSSSEHDPPDSVFSSEALACSRWSSILPPSRSWSFVPASFLSRPAPLKK